MRPSLKWLFLGVLAAQAAVAGLVTLVGLARSWRHRRSGFPHNAPRSAVVGEDEITIYSYGEDLYGDMLKAIRSARRQVLLDSFIWKGDACGKEFKAAVIDAAHRGVQVCVVYDGFANLVVPPTFKRFPDPIHALRFPVFAPGWHFYDPRRYGRDHRKILVVDGEVGFLGGYNIGSLYARHWRDTHLRVRGPGCWHLHHAFVEFWNAYREDHHPDLDQPEGSSWDPRVRLHRNVPRVRVFPIRDMYLSAIAKARSHIYLAHAYFVPDRDIRDALLEAVGRGVDVRVLTARTSNHAVMDWLGRGLYGELLAGGVRIFLYEKAMIHQKAATIDGQWSTIGTANVDRMSLVGNYELNAEVFDPHVARHMEDIFATDCSQGRELDVAEWEQRPAAARLAEAVLAPLRPLL